MKYKRWFISTLSSTLGLIICMHLNACSLMDIDSPLPPNKFLWEKKGVSDEQILADLRRCKEISKSFERSEEKDESDKCMLKKGYKFIPHPKGWRNYCVLFPERLSCKSARGKIKIEPDKPQIIPPESIQK